MHGNIMTDLGEEKSCARCGEYWPADEIYQVLEDDVLDTLRTYSRPNPVIEEAKAAARRDELAAIGATSRAYPRWLAIYCSAYTDDAVHERRIEWK